MASIKSAYQTANTAITMTLAALASSDLLTGQVCTLINNGQTNADLDHLLTGSLTVNASTAPNAGTVIEVWVFAPIGQTTATAFTMPDSISQTNAAKVFASANLKAASMVLARTITLDTQAGRAYPLPPMSVANLFGGTLPFAWGVFVAHNAGAALSAGSLSYMRVQGLTA
jgi:hypothetical protein